MTVRFDAVRAGVDDARKADTRPEELSELLPDLATWSTVVIATRNEADSIVPLLEPLSESLVGAVAELLFVDDSDDTREVIRDSARSSALAVRMLDRLSDNREGGLSRAVVAGLRYSRGVWAVVTDGDCQHPSGLVARMGAIGQSRQLDLLAGRRHIGAGTSDGLSTKYRRDVSGFVPRAVEIRQLLEQGIGRYDIASYLRVSPNTVRSQALHILNRHGTHSALAAVGRMRSERSRIPLQVRRQFRKRT